MSGTIAKKYITVLLIVTTLLVCLGLIFIYSSSSVFALERFNAPGYFVKKQLIGLVLGLILLVLTTFFSPRGLKKLAPIIFIAALILTACTLIPGLGITIHGSKRWLNLAGFVFQPSEFLKPATVLMAAYILDRNYFATHSLFKTYVPMLALMGMIAGILLLQPDFGQTVTLCATMLSMLFIAYTPISYLLYTGLLILPILLVLVVLKPYRFERILTFLNPWQDPQGKGFQIIQSLIAIGSGGFWGVGIAHSKQKFFYLPMQHTDFIFSIIAEETGFIGCLLIIALYIIFWMCGIKLALATNDIFARLTLIGCSVMITLQAFINISVTTAFLPTKGLGLPFISYGNSALIASLWLVGIMIACSKKTA
ncbi:MAG: Lipid II flippase FtsW [candidate division TM6 bacterium GW2011_GWE2_41_16]|nr:MAG: Lipid II flippase FtsW [candidate division TM6 bacterium GW2011_GWE2_41_16]